MGDDFTQISEEIMKKTSKLEEIKQATLLLEKQLKAITSVNSALTYQINNHANQCVYVFENQELKRKLKAKDLEVQYYQDEFDQNNKTNDELTKELSENKINLANVQKEFCDLHEKYKELENNKMAVEDKGIELSNLVEDIVT